jgi:hypothetical protein
MSLKPIPPMNFGAVNQYHELGMMHQQICYNFRNETDRMIFPRSDSNLRRLIVFTTEPY